MKNWLASLIILITAVYTNSTGINFQSLGNNVHSLMLNGNSLNLINLIHLIDDKTIKELRITNTTLKQLPSEIINLESLESIVITNNPDLDLANLILLLKKEKIVYLDISNNNLREIPECVFKFTNLHTLNASNNKISNISEKIVNLEKLNYLDLSENEFNEIPKAIGKLKNLKRLWILKKYRKPIIKENFSNQREHKKDLNNQKFIRDYIQRFEN